MSDETQKMSPAQKVAGIATLSLASLGGAANAAVVEVPCPPVETPHVATVKHHAPKPHVLTAKPTAPAASAPVQSHVARHRNYSVPVTKNDSHVCTMDVPEPLTYTPAPKPPLEVALPPVEVAVKPPEAPAQPPMECTNNELPVPARNPDNTPKLDDKGKPVLECPPEVAGGGTFAGGVTGGNGTAPIYGGGGFPEGPPVIVVTNPPSGGSGGLPGGGGGEPTPPIVIPPGGPIDVPPVIVPITSSVDELPPTPLIIPGLIAIAEIARRRKKADATKDDSGQAR